MLVATEGPQLKGTKSSAAIRQACTGRISTRQVQVSFTERWRVGGKGTEERGGGGWVVRQKGGGW